MDKTEESNKSQRALYKSTSVLVEEKDKLKPQITKTDSKKKELYRSKQEPVKMKIPDYKDADAISDPMGPQTSKRADSVSMKSKPPKQKK